MKKNKKLSGLISLLTVLSIILGLLSITASATLEESAETFNSMVSLLSSTNALDEKGLYLDTAEEALNEYIAEGGSVEDEAIRDAYAIYIEEKSAIDSLIANCESFIIHVEGATVAQDYAELKEHMLAAAELFDSVDKTYTGVAQSKTTYLSLKFDLDIAEKSCENYISLVNEANAAETYREKNYILGQAKIARNVSVFIDYPGILDVYPGIAEADQILAEVENYIAQALIDASPFLIAVKNISSAENIPAGVLAAYAELEGIDKTVAGVEESLAELRTVERNYNSKAEDANAKADAAAELIFGFIH